MAKNQIIELSTTAASNTDFYGENIDEGMQRSKVNNAMRALGKILADAVTRPVTKTVGSYTALKTDHNQFWRCTGAVTINLTAAATLTSGWCLWVRANGGAVTIDPNSTETLDGSSTAAVIPDGQSVLILCDGTGFYLMMRGWNTQKPATQQRFTSSGTYTKPAGLAAASIEVWGPGGSGAGATGAASNSSWGSGGGAGEYSRLFVLASSIAATETVTVGTGGTAPAAADPANNGNAGSGPSSFGTLVTAGAGGGGVRQTSGTGLAATLGGSGGSGGTGGDIMISGEHGGRSIRLSGTGGVSGLGGGRGGGVATNVLGTGGAGDIGAGGGGAGSTGTSQQVGGAGGNGLVVVTEYY